jgi:hypothetical protein
MAAIKLMTIKNVQTTYGLDQRCVYAYHLLAENVLEFGDTYNSTIFFEAAQAYLTQLDASIVSFEGSSIGKVVD